MALSVLVETTADDWPAAQTREVFSASRDYFVRVIPGASLGDSYGFAGRKKGKFAAAEFYRRDRNRSYALIAQTLLANPVAPVEFFVSDHGHLATLDNWHNRGYGKVVTLYGSDGRLIQSYTLEDLFLPEEIKDFPHSVSSIQWHNGRAAIRQDQKTFLVTVKNGGDFLFGLETGRYKYCEYRDMVYRCRIANANREWQPNNKTALTH